MGSTVASMFHNHGAPIVGGPGGALSVPWAAIVLFVLAAAAALFLRRGGGNGRSGGRGAGGRGGRSGRSGGSSVVRALSALGAGPGQGGPPLRVLSRLTLGPGRYLCTVEAGDRVILVAVGSEVKLMGEVQMPMPRSRRRRQAVAHELLMDKAGAFGASGDADIDPEFVPGAAATAALEALGRYAKAASGGETAAITLSGPAPTPAPASEPQATLAPSTGDAEDEDPAEYFTRLLNESMSRMEAADARLARSLARSGSRAGAVDDGEERDA